MDIFTRREVKAVKYVRFQDEIQNNEILKRAFSKSPDELNDIERKAVEKFLERKLAEIRKFMADRGIEQ